MPTPDSSLFTRHVRQLAIVSAKSAPTNSNSLYVPAFSAVSLSNFIPAARPFSSNGSSPAFPISQTSTVLEQSRMIFTVMFSGVADGTILYWTTSGTAVASDFTDDSDSGTITVNAGMVTVTREIAEGVDPTKTFRVSVRSSSSAGPIVASSNPVNVSEIAPSYSVTADVTSLDEGQSVTFTVTTTNVPDGTTLYWTTAGTATAEDFDDDADNGSFTVTSGTATITRPTRTDALVDPSEVFTLSVRTGSVSGTIVATSEVVTIVNTTPSYEINPNVVSVDEGESVVFTVTTANVPDGTTLYWTNSGSTTAEDFTDNQNSGSFTVTSGTATITRTLLLDDIASELETVVLDVRTDSVSGEIVATSGTVSVVERSAIYAVSASTSTVDEGQSVTFTVTTSGVPDGTTVYWTISGTAVAADFTDDAASGSFTVNSNSGTIVRTLKNDVTTEGTQSFTLSIRTTSVSGTVVATSSTITISDTSFGTTFGWVDSTNSVDWSYNMSMSYDGNVLMYWRTRLTPTSNTGVYVSTDGGSNWQRRVTGLPDFITTNQSTVRGIAMASVSSNIAYVTGSTDTIGFIWKTTNFGSNWSNVSPDSVLRNQIVCSADGQTVIAGTLGTSATGTGAGIMYSTNGGTSWSQAGPAELKAGGGVALAVSADGMRMYAGTSSNSISRIWRSVDRGANWTAVTGTFDFVIASCSADGQVILVGRNVSTGSTTPYLSIDGGTTWSSVTALPGATAWSYMGVSGDGNTLVATRSASTTVFVSTNKGASWIEDTAAGTRSWTRVAVDASGRKIALSVGGSNSKVRIGTR
jgi:hypothetical protein